MSLPENTKDELGKIAPSLSKIKKENPFIVPENYFESLPHTIQKSCTQASTQKTGWSFWITYLLRPQVSIPLTITIVLLTVVIRMLTSNQNPKAPDNLLSYQYLSQSDIIESMDESLLIETLIDKLPKNNNGNLLNKEENSNVIEDYLINNNIDISAIINEL